MKACALIVSEVGEEGEGWGRVKADGADDETTWAGNDKIWAECRIAQPKLFKCQQQSAFACGQGGEMQPLRANGRAVVGYFR